MKGEAVQPASIWVAIWVALLALAWPAIALAKAGDWRADASFVQAGWATQGQTATVGLTWDTPWQREFASGRLAVYWEASVGRWRSEIEADRHESAWVTQLGITPVLQWQPHSWERWFVEAGIGANVLLPIYRSGDNTFSTAFNFGDHIAIGRHLDPARQHELLLRLQHYSNAGIKHPNPGENFVQLRYVHRF